MTEPTRDYLWDKSGTPDHEIERLESLLTQFCSDPRPRWIHDPLPSRAGRRPVKRLWWSAVSATLAAIVLVTVALADCARFEWRPGDPWRVVALSGSPHDCRFWLRDRAQFSVGQALVTDAGSPGTHSGRRSWRSGRGTRQPRAVDCHPCHAPPDRTRLRYHLSAHVGTAI